jgi:hypothetical protein
MAGAGAWQARGLACKTGETVVRRAKQTGAGVSNTDSFIDEVTEEVRRDRLFAIFRKYGWIGILGVVLIVGGASWNEWQKVQQRASAEAFGDAIMAALDAADGPARRAALAQVQADAGQKAILDMLLASDPAEDKAGSLAALARIAADTTLSPSYRDLAVLKQVVLAGADMTVSERRAALDPITAPGRPYRTLALEQVALLAIEAGDIDAALTTLRALTQDQQATAGLRRRATQLIVALGGEVASG